MSDAFSEILLSGTDYSVSATIRDVFGGRGGNFLVENGLAWYRLQYGKQGDDFWTVERRIRPGGGPLEAGISGIQFRNDNAGQAATVSASIARPDEPFLAPTFSGSVGSSMITGRVAADGTVLGGTGFTVVKGAAGIYTITYTTAFTAIPVVLPVPQGIAPGINPIVASYQNSTVSSVEIDISQAGAAAVNQPFNFAAISTI